MIFKSKMIHDPGQGRYNMMGLTIGLTFHTPKYWNCRKHDFDLGWLWLPPESLTVKMIDRRIDEAIHHASCKWPYRHQTYKGYMYWTGPKRRYDFYHQKQSHHEKRKWFSVREHGMYTRLLDNGPQSAKQEPVSQDWIDALRKRHMEEAEGIKKMVAARRKERGL